MKLDEFDNIYSKFLISEYFVLNPAEVYATLNGIKPVTRKGISKREILSNRFLKFKSLCKELGLIVYVGKMIRPVIKVNSKKDAYLIYISRDEEKIRELIEYEKNMDHEKIGELLGYPKCCRKFYSETIVRNPLGFESKLYYTFRNTKSKGKISHVVNNIFSFETRFWKSLPSEHLKIFEKISKFMFYYIFHIPCSYDCKRSIEQGKKVREILLEKLPKFTSVLDSLLGKPVIFINDFNWAILSGKFEDEAFIYNGLILPVFTNSKIEKIIARGNCMRIEEKAIKIFNKDKEKEIKIGEINGIFLNFEVI